MATKSATAKNTTKAAAKKVSPAKGTKVSKADKPGVLERHPLSERYGPKMSDEELQGLADDLRAHGLHEPIIMYEGKVLAGWNRYRAAKLAGFEPDKRDLPEGKDPTAVAFGTNFLRRKLGSVQKAFYGAQFCTETAAKQADVAKMLACNVNRLNQCCQLLKLETPAGKAAVESLRENSEMSSSSFDELMLELGIARPTAPKPPRPARANDPLIDDDDVDFEDDDLTAGAIAELGDDLENLDEDDESPEPAVRAKKGSKALGEEIGDDTPLPKVGAARSSMTNAHETVVSRVAKAFRKMSAGDQRQFVKFAWAKLRAALDEAISHGDVEYELPGVKPDPSLIVRGKPAGRLDDGAASPPKRKAPAKKTKPTKPAKKAPPKKAKAARGKDHDI